ASATASASTGRFAVSRMQRLAVDGRSLTLVSTPAALRPGTFYVDTLGKWLYVGQDPAMHAIQVPSADIGILVTGNNVRVGGISVHDFATIGLRVAGSGIWINDV